MFELKGKYGTAKIFTDLADDKSISQVMGLLNQPFSEGQKIRLMPDIHAGFEPAQPAEGEEGTEQGEEAEPVTNQVSHFEAQDAEGTVSVTADLDPAATVLPEGVQLIVTLVTPEVASYGAYMDALNDIYAQCDAMVEARKTANHIVDEYEKAVAYHGIADMLFKLRRPIDKLEEVVDNKLWPLPKYRELLFIS